MNTHPTRVVIYTQDVSNITGLGSRAARKLLSAIRKALNKPARSFVTINDFAAYTGISEDTLRTFLT